MSTPTPGYSLRQLAQLTDTSPRAIRFWIQRGVLPGPKLRAAGTRYTDEHVARIRVMRLLREQGFALNEIGRRFRNATAQEIAGWAVAPPVPASAPTAPAPAAPAPAAPAAPAPVAPAAPGDAAAHAHPIAGSRRAEGWQRVVLLPGLELHYRNGSGEVIWRIASEIAARYAMVGEGGEG